MNITNQQIRDRMGVELYSASSLGDIESMRHRMEREEALLQSDRLDSRRDNERGPIKKLVRQEKTYDVYCDVLSEDDQRRRDEHAKKIDALAGVALPQPSTLQRMYDALTKGGVFECVQHIRPDRQSFTVRAKVTEENWPRSVFETLMKSSCYYAVEKASNFLGYFWRDFWRGGKTITITATLQPNGSVDVKASVE